MNQLKSIRESRGIRQIDLATQLNVSQGTLSNWERNVHDPDMDSLVLLSKILDVSTDYLLGIPEQAPSQDSGARVPPTKKELTPREELSLMLERVPDDKLEKFASVLQSAIDAVS